MKRRAFVFTAWAPFQFSGGEIGNAKLWFLSPLDGERRVIGIAETLTPRGVETMDADQAIESANSAGFEVIP